MNSTRFGDGKAYLITSKKLYDGMLNQLEKRWNIQPFAKPFKYETEPLTRNNLRSLRKTEYLIHPNTVGTKYLLYLTVYAGKKYVLFISPKHEKIFAAKNLFPPKDDTTASLFTDTIIKTELVKSDKTNKWHLIANDVLIKFGDDLRSTLPTYQERITQLYKLEKLFQPNRFDGITYETNIITDTQSFKHLVTKILPSLKYPAPSIIFVPKYKKYGMRSLLYNVTPADTPQQATLSKFMVTNTNPALTSTDTAPTHLKKPIYANFEVNMTSKSDVYQLYYYDKSNTLVNYGLGYIADITHSRKMIAIFQKVPPTPIPDHTDLYELKITMRCEYSPKFDKWKPLEPTSKTVSSIKDIEKAPTPVSKK